MAARTSQELRDAARLVASAYRENTVVDELPAELTPTTVEEARLIQDMAAGILGWGVVGWKVGHINPAMRRKFGSAAPVPGRFFTGSVIRSPAQLASTEIVNPFVEGELAVTLAEDCPPRSEPYTRDELVEVIDSVIPAIEFADIRCAAITAEDVLPLTAFNAGAHRLVLGSPITDWRESDVMVRKARITLDGETAATEYTDDRRTDFLWALEWFANYLSAQGIGMWKGQIFSTGVVLPYLYLGSARSAAFQFEGCAPVELHIVDG